MTSRAATRDAGSIGEALAAVSLPTSSTTFPDGVRARIEIPSVEGPACLRAVLEEAEALDVPVRRLSQGTGVFLLSDRELDEMATDAAEAGLELSLFARPVTGWGISATARAPAGAGFAATVQGNAGLRAAMDDITRAAAHGVRSVLISDVGLLELFARRRAAGDLPATMQAKISVMLPISNPATASVLVALGANTLNLQTDLSLGEIAEIRQVVDVPLDIYVETPDNLGGFLRQHELSELVRIAAPVYLKFGLRNAPDVYPAGSHLDSMTVALSRERVRRAALGLELMARSGTELVTSKPGAEGLAVPEVRGSR